MNRIKARRVCGTLAGVGRANDHDQVGNANNANGVAASTVTPRCDGPCRYNQTAEHDRGTDDLTRAETTEDKEPLWRDMLISLPNHLADRMDKGWVFGHYKALTVYEPKKRLIHYHAVRDDIAVENAVSEVCENVFINAIPECSYASVKGRGIHSALKALRRACANYPEAYYVKSDFRHFYESIDHERLIGITSRLFANEPRIADFYARLIRSYEPGIPIGNHTSHFLGNIYLAELDRRLSDAPYVLGVVRYMDDIAVLTPDKASAHAALDIIITFASEASLTVKSDVRIAPVSTGIDMVGYVVYPTHVRLRKSIKLRMRRKCRSLMRRGVDGKAFMQATSSYYGWCKFANARHLLQCAFGSRLKLFDMKIRRKRDLKPRRLFFGLPKEKFVSITTLVDKEIFITEVMEVTIKGVPKLAIKFCLTADIGENPSEDDIERCARYTITASDVIRDRLANDADILPCAVTIRKVNNRYYSYE